MQLKYWVVEWVRGSKLLDLSFSMIRTVVSTPHFQKEKKVSEDHLTKWYKPTGHCGQQPKLLLPLWEQPSGLSSKQPCHHTDVCISIIWRHSRTSRICTDKLIQPQDIKQHTSHCPGSATDANPSQPKSFPPVLICKEQTSRAWQLWREDRLQAKHYGKTHARAQLALLMLKKIEKGSGNERAKMCRSPPKKPFYSSDCNLFWIFYLFPTKSTWNIKAHKPKAYNKTLSNSDKVSIHRRYISHLEILNLSLSWEWQNRQHWNQVGNWWNFCFPILIDNKMVEFQFI